MRAAEDGGGGGIEFDVDNEGGWLFVRANDETEAGGSPFGYGIDLRDSSSGGMRLKTFAELLAEAATTIALHAFGGAITIQTDEAGSPFPSILLSALGGQISLTGDSINIQGNGAAAFLTLAAAGAVALSGSDVSLIFSGNLVLQTLPTADPGVSGALWNDSGTVKVSP